MHVLTSTMMLPPAKPKICAAPNKSMKTHYIYTFLYYVLHRFFLQCFFAIPRHKLKLSTYFMQAATA